MVGTKVAKTYIVAGFELVQHLDVLDGPKAGVGP